MVAWPKSSLAFRQIESVCKTGGLVMSGYKSSSLTYYGAYSSLHTVSLSFCHLQSMLSNKSWKADRDLEVWEQLSALLTRTLHKLLYLISLFVVVIPQCPLVAVISFSLKLSTVCLACSMNLSLCDTLTQCFVTGSLYIWQGPWDEAIIIILQTHTVVGCLFLSFSSLKLAVHTKVRKDGKADRGWKIWEQLSALLTQAPHEQSAVSLSIR